MRQPQRDLPRLPMVGSRQVLADFDGGDITSDGGSLLLRKTERAHRRSSDSSPPASPIIATPNSSSTPLEDLIAQRVYALALGYEDLNDHDDLRHDPLLAAVVGKTDPTGKSRPRKRDRGKALAGKSTLNRLELTPVGADKDSRYKKIVCRTHERRTTSSSTLFLQAHPGRPSGSSWTSTPPTTRSTAINSAASSTATTRITAILPLYIFCGDHLLCARLRPADIDACGRVGEAPPTDRGSDPPGLAQVKIVDPRRQRVLPRTDHAWCEANGVDYILGLAQNTRLLKAMIADRIGTGPLCEFERDQGAGPRVRRLPLPDARELEPRATGGGQGRAPGKGSQPAVRGDVVGSPAASRPGELYEEDYCGRGEMENRIKEQQLAPVRRSDQCRDDAGEPDPVVLLVDQYQTTTFGATELTSF